MATSHTSKTKAHMAPTRFWQTDRGSTLYEKRFPPFLPLALSPRIGLSNRRATRDSWSTCSVSSLPPSSVPLWLREVRPFVGVFSLIQRPQSVSQSVSFAAGGRKRSSALHPKKCRFGSLMGARAVSNAIIHMFGGLSTRG